MKKEELIQRFNFLNAHNSKEAYIYDILNEIFEVQKVSLREGKRLITLNNLKESNNIGMPFNNARNKNILYILDLLRKNYPDYFKIFTTYQFEFDKTSKKLNINEIYEFAVLLKEDAITNIQKDRDKKSIESLLSLVGSFRVFNLTKLIQKAKNKNQLSRIIKEQINNTIFAYKNYSIDKTNAELIENFCFHKKNYTPVKNKINTDGIKKIVAKNLDPINRRLSTLGILNSSFNDYTDSKLDYILNILINEISAPLSNKDLSELKTFNSLRNTIIKIDKSIDPLTAMKSDITKYIKEVEFARESDILSVFRNISKDQLHKWNPEEQIKEKIYYLNDNDESYYFDMEKFTKIFEKIMVQIFDEDNFSSTHEKKEILSQLKIFISSGNKLIESKEDLNLLIDSDSEIELLKQLLERYKNESLKKQKNQEPEVHHEEIIESESILSLISNYIKSLFSGKDKTKKTKKNTVTLNKKKKNLQFADHTISIYNKIKNSSSILIPISNYLEIKSENEKKLDEILDEIRSKNLKTIIPIYNARTTLYPDKSRKLLIADTEYLLADPEIIKSPEIIRKFSDQITGHKLKDEVIPGNTILVIEKYLLTIFRQNRMRRKKIQND